MPVPALLVLSAAAGLNPWVTCLMVAGLASFTSHAPLAPGWEPLGTPAAVAALALLLGIDLVASKVRVTAKVWEWVDVVVAPLAGALLALALRPASGGVSVPIPALAGAGVALLLRLAVRRLASALAVPLRPYGRMAAGMLANLLAAVTVAGVFAIAR